MRSRARARKVDGRFVHGLEGISGTARFAAKVEVRRAKSKLASKGHASSSRTYLAETALGSFLAQPAHAVGSWLSTSGVGRRAVVSVTASHGADLTAVGWARKQGLARASEAVTNEASHGPVVERRNGRWMLKLASAVNQGRCEGERENAPWSRGGAR